MRYFVSLGGREVEVGVDGDQVTVEGRTYTATLATVPGTPVRQLLLDGRPAELVAERLGGGRWALTLRGEREEMEVVDERTRHIRGLAGRGGRPAGAGLIRAPMPGLVLRVEVSPGQPVSVGAGLVVLEAMKMENELKAPAPGLVRAVLVEAGQAVEKGQPLIEISADHP